MAIRRLKDGRWTAYWRDKADGKLKHRYFGRGPEAQAAARAFNATLGLATRRPDPADTGPLFGDLVNQYAAARATAIQEASLVNFMWKMQGVILPALGTLHAMAVSADTLDRYAAARLATARRTDPETGAARSFIKRTTVHRELSDIRAVLNWAVRRRLIPWYPADGFEMPRRDDEVIAPPAAAEIAAIAANAPERLVRALAIAYYTGTRPGTEILERRWQDVDLQARTIFIESARKGGRRARSVYLHDDLLALLTAWRTADEKLPAPPERIVHYKGRPVGSLKKCWSTAKRKAGITRRLRPYDLRHAMATAALSHHADLKSTSLVLGHTRTDTTTMVYQHHDTELQRDVIRRLPSVIDPRKHEAG